MYNLHLMKKYIEECLDIRYLYWKTIFIIIYLFLNACYI